MRIQLINLILHFNLPLILKHIRVITTVIHCRPIQRNIKSFLRSAFIFNTSSSDAVLLLKFLCPSLDFSPCFNSNYIIITTLIINNCIRDKSFNAVCILKTFPDLFRYFIVVYFANILFIQFQSLV